jgi:hypothetical protein
LKGKEEIGIMLSTSPNKKGKAKTFYPRENK